MFDSKIVYTVPGLILEEMHERSLALDYNRCYRKPGSFSKRMQELYEEFLRGATDEEVARIRKNTRNSWRGAEMPIVPIMVHEHKNLQPCEPHMRVAIGGDYSFIIDLTMEDFDLIVRVNEQEE